MRRWQRRDRYYRISRWKKSLQIKCAIDNQQGIAMTLANLAQVLEIHQHYEAILRRIGSPDAETVARILQQVEGMEN